MENYEEKYNNLFCRLKALVDVQPEITKSCFLKQFPELAESEDEKIRKSLKDCFEWLRDEAAADG